MPACFDQRFADVVRSARRPCVSLILRVHPDHRAAEVRAHAAAVVDAAAGPAGALLGSRRDLATRLVELHGLAVAARAGGVAAYRSPTEPIDLLVPLDVDDVVAVADDPFVLPLVPAVSARWTGHVLLVDRDGLDLHRWLDGALVPVAVDGLTGTGARDLRACDERVLRAIGRSGELVLVGSPGEVARYQHVTRHPWTLALALGSPGSLDGAELRRAVAEVATITRANTPARAVAHYAAMRAAGRTTTDPAELTRAAERGRVEALLVGPALAAPGHAAGILAVGDRPDLAAANGALLGACRHGAVITHVEADRALDAPMAAVLRA